jgi:hypothetical protein
VQAVKVFLHSQLHDDLRVDAIFNAAFSMRMRQNNSAAFISQNTTAKIGKPSAKGTTAISATTIA